MVIPGQQKKHKAQNYYKISILCRYVFRGLLIPFFITSATKLLARQNGFKQTVYRKERTDGPVIYIYVFMCGALVSPYIVVLHKRYLKRRAFHIRPVNRSSNHLYLPEITNHASPCQFQLATICRVEQVEVDCVLRAVQLDINSTVHQCCAYDLCSSVPR